ncbi:TetR/AcrR family transcriptional regulator [Ktedonosporobacter rubrisoli]|nr:TetR/AcrR family transcriptional regulator [Ktedonosporobacter rubrisoli]
MTVHKSEATRKSENRAQALVLAAYNCIAEKGFEGLRLREIAEQVGINHATLHHYFPTKEALIQAVVLYATQRLAQTVGASEGAPAEQLRAHFKLIRQQMQEEPSLFIVLTEVGMRAQRDPAIRAIASQQAERWHAFFVKILKAGIEQGDWSADLDAEAAASTIVAVIQSITLINTKLSSVRMEQALQQLERWLVG